MKPDKIYLFLSLLILLTVFSWITSCTHVANIANLPEVCFTGDVLPVFVNNCAIAGCHDGAGRESRMSLNNYADIVREISPGNPNSSRAVSYTHLRAHETDSYLVCRLLLEKKKN